MHRLFTKKDEHFKFTQQESEVFFFFNKLQDLQDTQVFFIYLIRRIVLKKLKSTSDCDKKRYLETHEKP